MNVTVVCFGKMREYLPGDGSKNRTEVDIEGPASIRDVVLALGAPVDQVFALLLDGRQARLDEEVHDGSEVTLMPPFTGG
jgi:molybdopterin converting factor small subunit